MIGVNFQNSFIFLAFCYFTIQLQIALSQKRFELKRCYTRVGWWISKVGEYGVKWKLLGIETAVVKGFFSKIIILDNKF